MRFHSLAWLGLAPLAGVACGAQAQLTPEITRTGELASPRVYETSGVAASRRHPGVLWTHNDSGDGPFLYATDLAGADWGRVRLRGATAVDWEDIASGPCPAGEGPCLYIADTGDNLERRLSVAIYAVPEPDPPAGPADTARSVPAQKLELVYPDGPHDVEAIYLTPGGASVYLVTKGRTGRITLFRLPREAWNARAVARATKVMDLPIVPQQMIGRWVTGAAISPDGRLVAVRTYTEIYFFRLREDGSLSGQDAPPACLLGRLEPQGEAVDFVNDTTLVLTSEAPGEGASGRKAPIHTVRCPGLRPSHPASGRLP